MSTPKAAIPHFDDRNPWGAYKPSGGVAAALALAHVLPPALAQLTKLLRRPVKYNMTTPLDINVWGLKLRVLPRGNIAEQKIYTAPQLFDREEFALLRRRLRPGGVFVDVGANAGAYSFWACHCMAGRGRIIAVEPDPEMRRRLQFNIGTNQLSNIEICAVALSDCEGTAELHVDPDQRGQNTLDLDEAQRAGGIRESLMVPVTTLPALLGSKGIGRIDVLKIDIEGYETRVLRDFLANAPESMWPSAVVSEFKDQTAAEILALFAQRGYRRRTTTKLNFVLERD